MIFFFKIGQIIQEKCQFFKNKLSPDDAMGAGNLKLWADERYSFVGTVGAHALGDLSGVQG